MSAHIHVCAWEIKAQSVFPFILTSLPRAFRHFSHRKRKYTLRDPIKFPDRSTLFPPNRKKDKKSLKLFLRIHTDFESCFFSHE